jgi:D-alanyl-D-alanine carboxypeptidase
MGANTARERNAHAESLLERALGSAPDRTRLVFQENP